MSGEYKCAYPESWEVIRLGSLVKSEKGKKPKNQAKERSSLYSLPYIDIQAFEKGIIKSWTDGKDCRFCTESDFLMVWDGSRSGLVGKGIKGALGSTLVRINFPLMENQYAFYFLQSKYQQINSCTKGSGTPHVDPGLLWNYEFPVAPLNEQRRIVSKIEEMFSDLDKAEESLRAAKSTLDIYRKSLLKLAFEGKLTAEWRRQNPDKIEDADALLIRIRKERKTHYQATLHEWEKAVSEWRQGDKNTKKPAKPKRLCAISDKPIDIGILGWSIVQLGLIVFDPVYGTSKKCDYDGGSIGVLRIPNIGEGHIDPTGLKSADFNETESRHWSLMEGDVLTIRSNGSLSLVGKSAIVKSQHTEYLFAGYLIRLRPIVTSLVPMYLVYLLMEPKIRMQIEKKAKSTSGVNNINAKELQGLNIPICPLAEQAEIVCLLDNAFETIEGLESEVDANLARTDMLRQSILKKAFSGQLVDQDSTDETAINLIDRIRLNRKKIAITHDK